MKAESPGDTLEPPGWWPSRYGAGDEAGALNEITAGGIVRAARLVQEGRIFDLAHVLDSAVPAFPGREFAQRLGPPDGGIGRNRVGWVVEQVSAPSQIGTHLDGLNHLRIGDRSYNGFRIDDIVEEWGTNRLGVETLPQIVTRGLLLDIAGLRGVERLAAGEVVTPGDADKALAALGLDVRPGDGVLFHTGWGAQWGVANEAYSAGEPGPGRELGAWLADRRVALTGCDTWSFGPVPPEDPDEPFVVPQILNAHHGVVVLENLRLAELAAAGVAEFLLVVSHAKLRGATGAWVAPLAVI